MSPIDLWPQILDHRSSATFFWLSNDLSETSTLPLPWDIISCSLYPRLRLLLHAVLQAGSSTSTQREVATCVSFILSDRHNVSTGFPHNGSHVHLNGLLAKTTTCAYNGTTPTTMWHLAPLCFRQNFCFSFSFGSQLYWPDPLLRSPHIVIVSIRPIAHW